MRGYSIFPLFSIWNQAIDRPEGEFFVFIPKNIDGIYQKVIRILAEAERQAGNGEVKYGTATSMRDVGPSDVTEEGTHDGRDDREDSEESDGDGGDESDRGDGGGRGPAKEREDESDAGGDAQRGRKCDAAEGPDGGNVASSTLGGSTMASDDTSTSTIKAFKIEMARKDHRLSQHLFTWLSAPANPDETLQDRSQTLLVRGEMLVGGGSAVRQELQRLQEDLAWHRHQREEQTQVYGH